MSTTTVPIHRALQTEQVGESLSASLSDLFPSGQGHNLSLPVHSLTHTQEPSYSTLLVTTGDDAICPFPPQTPANENDGLPGIVDA